MGILARYYWIGYRLMYIANLTAGPWSGMQLISVHYDCLQWQTVTYIRYASYDDYVLCQLDV